jgi:hypothetical protein
MERHSVSVLQRELLSREDLHSAQHLIGRRAFRHREDQVVHQFGRLASGGNRALAAASLRFEIEIPIFEKRVLEPLPLEALAVVSLYLSATVSANVVEVLGDPSKASRSA